jgi:ABC-type dipeptide/oligopeptide/nickel transport system ATPase component
MNMNICGNDMAWCRPIESPVVRYSRAGCGVPKPERAPAVIVTFVGTPGMGKTAIAKAVLELLPRSEYRVIHHHSDILIEHGGHRPAKFWPRAADLSIAEGPDQRTVVVLADKNLVPSPDGTSTYCCSVLGIRASAQRPAWDGLDCEIADGPVWLGLHSRMALRRNADQYIIFAERCLLRKSFSASLLQATGHALQPCCGRQELLFSQLF